MSDIEKASDRSSRNERRRIEKELADLTKKLTESQNQVTRFKTALDEADPDQRKAIEAKADEESLSEDLKPADLAMRRLLTAASDRTVPLPEFYGTTGISVEDFFLPSPENFCLPGLGLS